jgi:RNA polymerase sigma-70 factor (ECF subfamily)
MDRQKLFKDIYRENRDRIWRLCCGYCAEEDDRRDLHQAIFVKVWENLGSYRGQSKISTWLYRIAINTALMWVRREKRRQQLMDPTGFGAQQASAVPTPEENAQRGETFRRLADAINRLDNVDRLIIGMVLEDLPYAEIADVTGLTVNHVGVKITRIKQKLFSLMKE